MDRQQQVIDICNRIIRAFNPQRLIIFGSEAAGTARPDSDLDLLVVMCFTGSTIKQASRVYECIDDRQIPVDLVVRTPEQLQERDRLGDVFIREVLSKGKVIHDAARA